MKNKSIARDFEQSLLLTDMLKCLVTGLDICVRAEGLTKAYRQHEVSHVRFVQRAMHFENLRQDHLFGYILRDA